MGYKIHTTDNRLISITGAVTIETLRDQLNNQQLLTIPLANEVFSKDSFKSIVPDEITGGDYEIHTKDGLLYKTNIEGYDAMSISDEINASRVPFILIGSVLVQRLNIRQIKPSTNSESQ